MSRFIDLSGQKFGKLTVINRAENDRYGLTRWNCECDCGNKTTVPTGSLRGGLTTSCGCNRNKHGMCTSREYRSWEAMIQRTTNPNNTHYHDYGGRGITICDRWLSFENFYDDMGPRPEEYSLDRINNDLGYCKENCRWATNKEQNNNQRRNKWITYNGETKTMAQWSEVVGISCQVLYRRMNKLGWEVEKTLTTPVTRRMST